MAALQGVGGLSKNESKKVAKFHKQKSDNSEKNCTFLCSMTIREPTRNVYSGNSSSRVDNLEI